MGLLISIVLPFIYADILKNKIHQNKNFDGLVWGILMGLTGALLFAMICYVSVAKELDLLVDKQESSKKTKAAQDIKQLKRELHKGIIIGFVIQVIILIGLISFQYLRQF